MAMLNNQMVYIYTYTRTVYVYVYSSFRSIVRLVLNQLTWIFAHNPYFTKILVCKRPILKGA
jgi:hypothetical protein